MRNLFSTISLLTVAVILMASNSLAQNMRGHLDPSDCAGLYAWACDADRFDLDVNIELYADGPAGTGRSLGRFIANKPSSNPVDQSDIGKNCNGNYARRINPAIPDWLKDGKSHTVYAYGVDVRSDGTSGNLVNLTNSPRTLTFSCPLPVPTAVPTLTGALARRPSFVYVPGDKNILSLFSSVTAADYYMLGTFKGNPPAGSKLAVQLCGEYGANHNLNAFGYVSPNADAFSPIFNGAASPLRRAVIGDNPSVTYTLALNGPSGILTTVDGLNPGRLPAAAAKKIIADASIQMPQGASHAALACPVKAGDSLLAFEDTISGDSDFNDMIVIARQFAIPSLATLAVNDPAVERRWQITSRNETALDYYYEIGDLDQATGLLKQPVKYIAPAPLRINAGQTITFSTTPVSGDNYMMLYIKDERFGNIRVGGLANPAQPNPMVLEVSAECRLDQSGQLAAYGPAVFHIVNKGGVGYSALPYELRNGNGNTLSSGQIPQLKPQGQMSITFNPAGQFTGQVKLSTAAGVISSVLYDACGICGGDGSSCQQCSPTAALDQCGVCNGNNACLDCKGVPNGDNTHDRNGSCCLPSEMDQCGVCGGTNSCLDCMGIPDGTAKPDAGGICCPVAAIDSCGICGGRETSRGCDGVCGSGKVVDSFGVCGGSEEYSSCALVVRSASQRRKGLSLVARTEIAINDVRRHTAKAISCSRKNRKNDLKKAEQVAAKIKAAADALYLKEGRICQASAYNSKNVKALQKKLEGYRNAALRMVRSSCKVSRCECKGTQACK